MRRCAVAMCCLCLVLLASCSRDAAQDTISDAAKAWPPAGAEAGTAMYGQVPIHYLDMGQGGLPLVLIHGWACNGSFWRGQVPLAETGRVLIMDQPGQGESAPLDGPYSLDALGGAVLAVMDQAGVERAVLVGHSMGAAVAWRAAVLAPERVAGMVSVDGALFVFPEGSAAKAAWAAQMQGVYDSVAGPDGEAVTAGFIDGMHGRETPEELKREIKEALMATPRDVRLAMFSTMIDPDAWDNAVVNAPLLAIAVTSDDLPPDYDQTLRPVFPNLTYEVIDGPGHFVMMERPDEINQLIRDFMATLPR